MASPLGVHSPRDSSSRGLHRVSQVRPSLARMSADSQPALQLPVRMLSSRAKASEPTTVAQKPSSIRSDSSTETTRHVSYEVARCLSFLASHRSRCAAIKKNSGGRSHGRKDTTYTADGLVPLPVRQYSAIGY